MIRFGLIGCGRIAQRHIQTLSALPETHLHAVSDLDTGKMAETVQRYDAMVQTSGQKHGKSFGDTLSNSSSCRQYVDYHDLLQDAEIDVVIICTLSDLHAPLTRQALLAGKHVVLEKPLALSLQDADDIIDLAKKQCRQVLVCQQLRYRPLLQKIKHIIEQGALGRVYLGVVSIRISRPARYYAEAGWRGTWLKDGGMLINQGLHLIDLLQWYLGDISEVYGEISQGNIPKETEDVAVGLLRFKNQARGVIEANTLTFPDNMGYTLSLFAEKGTVSIGGARLDQVVRWSIADQTEPLKDIVSLARDGHEHEYMYQDLLQVLAGEKEGVLVDAQEGKKPLETIFSLYNSTLEHRPQKLPLSAFETSRMKGLNR